MSTVDPQRRKEDEKVAQEDRIQYVEELASAFEYPEGDAWISLTDAARVTRTSEAMARRWVTSGRLKVKKEAVGIPPRTRLVRLSDVAAIRPIVDPTAAITGEVRKLDLPSIPRQQLQIMEEHHHLLTQTEALRVIVEQETADLRRDLNALEARLHAKHNALTTQVTKQLADLRDFVTEQMKGMTGSIQEQHTELERIAIRLTEQQQQLTQVRTDVEKRVETLDQVQQHRLEEVATRLEAEDHAQQQHLEEMNTTLLHMRDAGEQQKRDISAQMETLERDQARDVAQLIQQLEAIAPQLAQIVTNATTALTPVQKRVEAQEQQIRVLNQEVQQERAARESLSTTLDAQREQLEALHSMVETLTKRKKG